MAGQELTDPITHFLILFDYTGISGSALRLFLPDVLGSIVFLNLSFTWYSVSPEEPIQES